VRYFHIACTVRDERYRLPQTLALVDYSRIPPYRKHFIQLAQKPALYAVPRTTHRNAHFPARIYSYLLPTAYTLFPVLARQKFDARRRLLDRCNFFCGIQARAVARPIALKHYQAPPNTPP
jgi:hypothetical protein